MTFACLLGIDLSYMSPLDKDVMHGQGPPLLTIQKGSLPLWTTKTGLAFIKNNNKLLINIKKPFGVSKVLVKG